MLSKEELKKVIDEFVSIPSTAQPSDSGSLRRKELLKMYAGDYVEFDRTYCASHVDADNNKAYKLCPTRIRVTDMKRITEPTLKSGDFT